MTRLERLFQEMDEALDKNGEYGFGPIPYFQKYLAERDAAVHQLDNKSLVENDSSMLNEYLNSVATRYDDQEVA